MPIIGAHVSAAGSLDLSFERAKNIGANATQIFISPPQQWFQTKHSDEKISQYHAARAESGIDQNFIHATYLINLGTKNPEHLQKSIDWLTYAMHMASKMGVTGVVFHTGSHKGEGFDTVLDQVVDSLSLILSKAKEISDSDTYLILENTAGAGGTIGRDFSEIGQILKRVQNDRLKICLDTQHAFAFGYDLSTKQGIEDMLEEFDREIGLEKLIVIHCNDSKTEHKSGRDRHENIGEGFIGQDAFEVMLNHPKLKHLPFILEVPGFEKLGPDQKNVDLLKSLVKE